MYKLFFFPCDNYFFVPHIFFSTIFSAFELQGADTNVLDEAVFRKVLSGIKEKTNVYI